MTARQPCRHAERFPLYDLSDLEAAIGIQEPDFEGDTFLPNERDRDAEHQSRLRAILARGENGRWRTALGPAAESPDALLDLARRAPHFEPFVELVRRCLLAARFMEMPLAIPPTVLVGEPGTGKTWFLSRLAGLFGLPFRPYPMNVATLSEGLTGAHMSWRNAQEGLVARTLLHESIGNPIVFVDEVDKPSHNGWRADPYLPFYALLDPAGSKTFVDEYLTFPIDASRVIWVMAANSIELIPDAVVDRLTVVRLPPMTRAARRDVAQSVYHEANIARKSFFEPTLSAEVLDRLDHLTPRSMRIVIEDAMLRAAARRAHRLTQSDMRSRPDARANRRIGFV